MDPKLRNSGEPRSLVVVRPATVSGIISGAIKLAWLVISSLGTEILYIIALLVGAVVGLSQGIFRVSVEVAKSPFTSPAKKTIGGDDGTSSGNREPAALSEAQPFPARVADDLRPRHLFAEPYDGLVDEQRGTEMHSPDDLVGPGTIEEMLVPTSVKQEISPEVEVPAPAVAEGESEKTEAAFEPIAVVLPPGVKEEDETDRRVHLTHPRPPVVGEKLLSPVEPVAPILLATTAEEGALPLQQEAAASTEITKDVQDTSVTSTQTPRPPVVVDQLTYPAQAVAPWADTAEEVLPKQSPVFESEAVVAPSSSAEIARETPEISSTFVPLQPEIITPQVIQEKEEYLTASELENNALITKSVRRSEEPSPEKALLAQEKKDFDAPETPKAEVAPPLGSKPVVENVEGASASSCTATATATAAPPIVEEQEPESSPSAISNAKPTVLDKHIRPAVVLEEEHKGNIGKKKKRGLIRGPLHKAAKEIRKAFH